MARDEGPEQAEQPEKPRETERPKKPETEWQRKRRLAEIFGDAEPERPSESATDRWLKDQIPPHHG